MSYRSLVAIFTGDMGSMRIDLYRGSAETISWTDMLPPALRYPFTILNYTFGASWIMMFLGFYCIFIQKLPFKYFIFFLLASIIGPLGGILGLDRSKVAYWIIALIGCYIFFRPYIEEKVRRKYVIFMVSLVGLLAIYLILMTESRFSEASNDVLSGSQVSVISYLGQSFVNFCFFLDEFEAPFLNPGVIMPFTFNSLLHGYVSVVEWQYHLSMVSHREIGVFYTFLGQIKIAMGTIAMWLYAIFVFLTPNLILGNGNKRAKTLYNSFIYFLFASIPMLGLFVYYYTASSLTFPVILYLIITSRLSSRNKNIIKSSY